MVSAFFLFFSFFFFSPSDQQQGLTMTDLEQWIFVERGPREKSFLIEAEYDWKTWTEREDEERK